MTGNGTLLVLATILLIILANTSISSRKVLKPDALLSFRNDSVTKEAREFSASRL
jgi:hypothetical protein